MRVDDVSYFRRRALQEQVAAQKATCEAARKRHDKLAAIYRFRVMMLARPASGLYPVRERIVETVR